MGIRRVAAVLVAAAAALPSRAQDFRPEIERTHRENYLLQQQLEVASAEPFYLVVDPATSALRLMLKGAILQEYKIRRIEVGGPRVLFVSRDLPEGWRGRVWPRGELAPPRDLDRVEFDAPPPSEDPDEEAQAPIKIPPTPEEKYPVPARFHVRFEGGLSMEIQRTAEAEAPEGWWASAGHRVRAWWDDAVAALRPSLPESDSVRLLLTMSNSDVDSLYRALPPAVSLLVLPDPEHPPASREGS